MSKRTKEGVGAIKKEQRQKAREGLPKYYVFIANDRHVKYGYTKLVNREKAADYVLGKWTQLGTRDQNLKDTYTMKEIV